MLVYENKFEMLKCLCDCMPNLDLVNDGAIPNKCGLANDSEADLFDHERRYQTIAEQKHNILDITDMSSITINLLNTPLKHTK